MFGRNLLDFWCQNGGKLAPKWDQKLMFTWEDDFSKIVLAAAGARFFRIWGSKLGAKIDQKSIEKWNPRWNASWHRFLNDFVGFGVPSWEAKSIKNRIEKTMQKTKPFGTRLGVSGIAPKAPKRGPKRVRLDPLGLSRQGIGGQ